MSSLRHTLKPLNDCSLSEEVLPEVSLGGDLQVSLVGRPLLLHLNVRGLASKHAEAAAYQRNSTRKTLGIHMFELQGSEWLQAIQKGCAIQNY